MPLYYITGNSGTGKSSVLAELVRRGYEAYDVDLAGPVTAKWHNIETGYIHPKSSVKSHQRTPEFVAKHAWKVPREEVEALVAQAGDKPIFVGGGLANEAEIIDLFTEVFALVINDSTMTERLTNRPDASHWGKQSHELQQSLTLNSELDKKYRDLGYTIIDANQPLDMVVDEILQRIA